MRTNGEIKDKTEEETMMMEEDQEYKWKSQDRINIEEISLPKVIEIEIGIEIREEIIEEKERPRIARNEAKRKRGKVCAFKREEREKRELHENQRKRLK